MPHALVIEDVFVIAMAIQDELTDCGFDTVDIAALEAEAITLASETCPDLITADDKLEEGSGITAIRIICEDMALPVVFITADPRRIRATVPDAVIVLKPFSPRELISAIEMATKAPFRMSEGGPT